MSVDYFLFSKKKHEIINNNLKEIISIYDELIEITKLQTENHETYDKEEDIKLYEEFKDEYENHLTLTTHISKTLADISCSMCNHNYILDLIDVTPDKSMMIEYCQNCGHTKQ